VKRGFRCLLTVTVIRVVGVFFVINVYTILDFVKYPSYNTSATERSVGTCGWMKRWLLSDAWMYPPFVHPSFTLKPRNTHEPFYQQGSVPVELSQFVRMQASLAHTSRGHNDVLVRSDERARAVVGEVFLDDSFRESVKIRPGNENTSHACDGSEVPK